MTTYTTSDFDYALPDHLIARYPLEERTASRLLCVNRDTGTTTHRIFSDVLAYFSPGDTLVLNDTRVMPARLWGKKPSGGRMECLVERVLSPTEALVHARANKALTLPADMHIEDAHIQIVAREGGFFLARVLSSHTWWDVMQWYGEMPLPPYLLRSPEASDTTRYQTVFAREPGAVAAPTASLHWDEALLQRVKERGVEIVTLHVGAGTFQPVRGEDLSAHVMHQEWLSVSADTVAAIQACHARGGQVTAVGTTVVRALEWAARSGTLLPYAGDTHLFIQPGYTFRVVDQLITNFHLPRSTLLLLVSAFAGVESVRCAYQAAIAASYRFFSYGDAMMIYRER